MCFCKVRRWEIYLQWICNKRMQKLQFTNVCNLIFIISSISYLTQCQLLFVLCNLSIFLNAIGTYICLRTECLLCTITKNKERSVYTFIFMPHFPNWVSYLVKENNLTKEKGNLISKYLLRLNRIYSFYRYELYSGILYSARKAYSRKTACSISAFQYNITGSYGYTVSECVW